MKLLRKVGAVSEIWQVFIADSSSTTGAGLAGLAFNTASLTAYYHRDTDTTATAITLATMTVGTFTSSGFKEIDATNMPGWYQFCPPNAAIASGAKSCAFHLKGATNMAPLPIEVDLDGQVDVTFWNGTVVATPATAGVPDINVKNINNVAAATPGASGGVLISGSNSGTTTLGALTVSGTTTLAAVALTTLTASGAVAFQSTFVVTTSTALGALSATTVTFSGAVAFQSTFVVTTSTSLAALSCTTLTASGAVAFQSTFAVTTSTSLAALSATTITASGTTSLAAVTTSGTVTLNAFTVTNAFTVSGTTTWTGAVQFGSTFTVVGNTVMPLTEAYAADGAAATLAQLLYMIYGCVQEFSISGNTISLKKVDGSTVWGVVTLDSSSSPTSRTRTS